ncbi:MAG: aminopeptidase [Bacillota bacterium]|nr:aminopeptidase [Bacillota bacterium]
MSDKTDGELLKDKLSYAPKNAYETMQEDEISCAYAFCGEYKNFLDNGKTERECVSFLISEAEKKGFKPFGKNTRYQAGDRVYMSNSGKSAFFFIYGKKSVDYGVKISAAHIDSPRLDLKPRPLFEDNNAALLKTHYYGGLKKYQWLSIPLSLHGVVCLEDGSIINVTIGEDEGDPIFVLNDLLPHLAKDQMEKTMRNGISGEGMNILVGSRPFKDDKVSEKVKLNILSILYEKYGITELDLVSAELEIVPAFKAKDVGLDRSLIGSYGHDDRVCAYPAMRALLDMEIPEYSCVCVLADKEEIGSTGLTGMQSHFMSYFLEDIAAAQNVSARDMFRNSLCLSADVSAAFDPNYADVYDLKNSIFLNFGIGVMKYTGHAGKGDTSDANAELVAKIRRIFKDVPWQIGELGKIDQGGGGTVAKYIAQLGVNTIDVGVPVLGMHSPYEVVSKLDVYNTYKAVLSFYNYK